MASALRASPEELVAAAASSWKGTASSSYQSAQERLNDLLRRSGDTLAAISENLASSGGERARQEGTSAQDLENIKGVDWGEDVFHHGEGGAQHVVREAGDKTTVECDPGKNCPEDLEKRLDEQQKEIDGKQDKKDFFDRLGPDVAEGAAIGGVGGAIGGAIFGGIAGGPAGALDGAIEGGVRGAIGGAMGGFGKDVVEWLES